MRKVTNLLLGENRQLKTKQQQKAIHKCTRGEVKTYCLGNLSQKPHKSKQRQFNPNPMKEYFYDNLPVFEDEEPTQTEKIINSVGLQYESE